jgi:hypothetical protein
MNVGAPRAPVLTSLYPNPVLPAAVDAAPGAAGTESRDQFIRMRDRFGEIALPEE